MSSPSPILIATDVELGYDQEPSILSGINFKLFPNEFVGITGPNGAGKTTFIRALLGLMPPRKGTIRYFAPDGSQSNTLSIGYMPQQNQLDKAFPISVEEVAMSGLSRPHTRRATKAQRRMVYQTLQMVEMEKLAKSPIGHLSGGQLQRVLLARACVSQPALLVLDEPSTFVDRSFEATMLQLLPQLCQHSAIMMVSHNETHLRTLSSRIYHIDRTFTLL